MCKFGCFLSCGLGTKGKFDADVNKDAIEHMSTGSI
jgi:hypothetical protein